jgi:cytoskeleton protein RodZ
VEGSRQPAALGAPDASNEALELGAMLREMRLALKRDIDDVAEELRVRPGFLRAIEEGRFSDLPGTTYALGFVRAYADALGLDANEAARRYKAATGGGTPQPNLVLPAPVASGGLPTGAVLFAAALLAVLAYGGWYALSTQGRDPGAMVAALPGQIASAVRDTLPARLIDKPSEGAAPSASRPPPAATSSPNVPAAEVSLAVRNAPMPDTAAAQEAETTEAVDEDEDTPPPPPEQVVSETPPPVTAMPAGQPPRPAPSPAAALPSSQQAALPASPQSSVSASSHRIVLVARTDSWVELRDSTGAPVYSRVLRKDERYEVPDKDGLVMMTGNAGGLEVLVDGHAAPALGAVGVVKRNIAMDPDKLRAGTAVPPAPPPQPATPAPAGTP